MASIYSPRYQDLVKNIIINDAVNNCHRIHPDSCVARFIKHNNMVYSPIEYAVMQRKIKVLKSLYEIPLKKTIHKIRLDQLSKAIHENNFDDLFKVLKKEESQTSSSASLYTHPSLSISKSLEKRSSSARTRSPSLTTHSRDISEESVPSLNRELSTSLSKTLPSCSSGLSESSISIPPRSPASSPVPRLSRTLPSCSSSLSESSISIPPRSPTSSPVLCLSRTLPSLSRSSIRTPSSSPAPSPSLHSKKILSSIRNSEGLAFSSRSRINPSHIEKRQISIFSMTEAKINYQSLKSQSRTIIPDNKIIEYFIKLLTLGFKIYSRDRSFYNKIALDILDLLYLPIQRKNLHNLKFINKLARNYLDKTRLIKMFTPLLTNFIKMEKNSSSLLNFHLEYFKLYCHFSKDSINNISKISNFIINLLYLQKENELSPEQKYNIYIIIYPYIDKYKELQNLKDVIERLVPQDYSPATPAKSCCTIL